MKKIDLKYYRIPKTVKIAGFVYEVLFPYSFKETIDYMGMHCEEDLLIYLTPYANIGELAPRSKVHESLLHEMVHGIDSSYFEGNMAHRDVYNLSSVWHQVLHDNDLNIKDIKKPLPKSVKILGGCYDVVKYTFEEVDVNSSISEDTSIFKIGKEITNLHYQRSLLVFCITTAIFCRLRMFDDDITDEAEINRSNFRVFSRAMYQVIVDNDLEKVMRNG